MSGLERIEAVFSKTKQEGRSALMPYFTLGFPDLEKSLTVVEAIATAGADLIELGVPFSDPLADGPTVQHSTQVALEGGTSAAVCLEAVRELRRRGIGQPLLLMGYYNPVLAYGLEKFVSAACTAGADGLIVPDLPLEEAGSLEDLCRTHRLALVYLVAPTTPDDRLAEVTKHSSGFVYIVSLTGVTGARQALAADLGAFLERVRNVTDKPLAVGFGISSPEQAVRVSALAEGVIIGSALIDAAGSAGDPAKAAGNFIADIRSALDKVKA